VGSKESKPIILSTEENETNEAIQRVYEKYGTDLSAFFRDVHEKLAIKRQEPSKTAEEGHTH
jgi:hypothetical protein